MKQGQLLVSSCSFCLQIIFNSVLVFSKLHYFSRYLGNQLVLLQQMIQIMEILYRRQKQWLFEELAHALDWGSTFIMKKRHKQAFFHVWLTAIVYFWHLAYDYVTLKQDRMVSYHLKGSILSWSRYVFIFFEFSVWFMIGH